MVVSRDPDAFFRLNRRRVAIDEAQMAPEIFPALRVAIDERRSEKGRFVITGSSSSLDDSTGSIGTSREVSGTGSSLDDSSGRALVFEGA